MPNIIRWSPVNTCSCVFEVEYDEELKDNKFLLVNRVCPKHKPLASTHHRENHSNLSKHTMDLIEEAKNRNVTQHADAIMNAESEHHRKEIVKLTSHINQFNANITDEWNELVTRTWAFDSHIYDQVLKESQNG